MRDAGQKSMKIFSAACGGGPNGRLTAVGGYTQLQDPTPFVAIFVKSI
jgi:hypothetical protein